jgi:hypothetical protein
VLYWYCVKIWKIDKIDDKEDKIDDIKDRFYEELEHCGGLKHLSHRRDMELSPVQANRHINSLHINTDSALLTRVP